MRHDSPIKNNAEVDRPGIPIVVGNASAYDLYLSREIRAATLQRAPTSPAVVDYFTKAGGFVASASARHAVSGAVVAPPVAR